MIACCAWLVQAMLGEPGDALRLRELKAGGRNVEFPTTEDGRNSIREALERRNDFLRKSLALRHGPK